MHNINISIQVFIQANIRMAPKHWGNPRAWKPATFISRFSWVKKAGGRYIGANFCHALLKNSCSIPQTVDDATPNSLQTIRNPAY